MKKSISRGAAGGLVLSLLVIACDSSREPATYALRFADGDTLPAVLRSERNCTHMLVGGNVVLGPGRQYSSDFDIEINCFGQPPRPQQEIGTKGRFRMNADTAVFTDSTGTPNGRGYLRGDTLIVRGPVRELLYVRETQ